LAIKPDQLVGKRGKHGLILLNADFQGTKSWVQERMGKPKILIIGVATANFTDVASTFTRIIQALTEFKDRLNVVNTKIYVRRGGPNY
jgi:succinyl-CoA synthetase beta subunit